MRDTSTFVVNLKAIARNVECVRGFAPNAKIIAMVKGNAYGHGIVPVSKYLVDKAGITTLGVASLGEALEIEKEIPDIASKANIIVFSDTEILDPSLRSVYKEKLFIHPVIATRRHFDAFMAAPELKDVPLYLKVNTGMNRLGIRHAEVLTLVDQLKSRGVKHLLQHFSVANEPMKEGDPTHTQYTRFQDLKKALREAGVSVEETSTSNSGAIQQRIGVDETYVRPGLMLYGAEAVPGGHPNGRMCGIFRTKVLETFRASAGECIGYGHNAVAKDSFVVLLPVGYADGLVRHNGRRLTINGKTGTFFGKINMDMSAVVFDEEPLDAYDAAIHPDDPVELWSTDNTYFTQVAVEHDTSVYQLTCNVSIRIPREYVERDIQ